MAINQYTFERRVIYQEFTYIEANTKKEAWKRNPALAVSRLSSITVATDVGANQTGF